MLANETRQQLLAGVSHDLRTPMSRLRLRIETQVDPAVSDELLYDLHGLERIVAQFLAYVHGQAHHEAGVMTPLRAVVEQVGSQLGCLHVRAELDTCMKPVPDLAVQRLLDNLIDNAMAHGAGPVTVRLAREAEHCVLTVFDHGPGLSAAVFVQALQPFVRLEASRPARAIAASGWRSWRRWRRSCRPACTSRATRRDAGIRHRGAVVRVSTAPRKFLTTPCDSRPVS